MMKRLNKAAMDSVANSTRFSNYTSFISCLLLLGTITNYYGLLFENILDNKYLPLYCHIALTSGRYQLGSSAPGSSNSCFHVENSFTQFVEDSRDTEFHVERADIYFSTPVIRMYTMGPFLSSCYNKF